MWRVIVVQAKTASFLGWAAWKACSQLGETDGHFLVRDTGHHVMPCLAESVTLVASHIYAAFVPLIFSLFYSQFTLAALLLRQI